MSGNRVTRVDVPGLSVAIFVVVAMCVVGRAVARSVVDNYREAQVASSPLPTAGELHSVEKLPLQVCGTTPERLRVAGGWLYVFMWYEQPGVVCFVADPATGHEKQ